MSAIREASPRLTEVPPTLPAPAAHTEAELAAMLDLLARHRSRIDTVAIGHSRDAASVATADAFATAWQDRGGLVLATVDWPETAASWLRPARRLAAQSPDAWVIAAVPLGWVQLARRLWSDAAGWDPARSFGFASLRDPQVSRLAGPLVLHGMRGVTAEGGTWETRQGWAVTRRVAS